MLHFLVTNREILKDRNGSEYIEEDGLDTAGEPGEKIRFAVFDSEKFIRSNNPRSSINLFIDGSVDEIAKEISIGEGDLLCYIHGFHTDFRGTLKDICALEKKYIHNNSPVKHIIAITWPARKNIWGYEDDARDAERSGKTFALSYPLLKQFFSVLSGHQEEITGVKGKNIHLLAHSMGNRMLLHLVDRVVSEKDFIPHPVFKEVILAASDVDWNVFEEPYAFSKLCLICERVTVYHHLHDAALFLSERVKNKSKRLGRYGFRDMANIPKNVYSVDCSDVSDNGSVINKIIDHAYFHSCNYTVNDIVNVLSGRTIEYFVKESLRIKKADSSCQFRIKKIKSSWNTKQF
jgi:esterase/lipase superfamily enzyme